MAPSANVGGSSKQRLGAKASITSARRRCGASCAQLLAACAASASKRNGAA